MVLGVSGCTDFVEGLDEGRGFEEGKDIGVTVVVDESVVSVYHSSEDPSYRKSKWWSCAD